MVEAEAPNTGTSEIDNRTCVSKEAGLFVECKLDADSSSGTSFSKPQVSDTTSIEKTDDTRSNIQISCPKCGNKNVVKDGQRYLYDGTPIQRWLCKNKNCFHRFSEKDPNSSNESQCNPTVHTQSLKSSSALLKERQVCDFLQESKNLTEQTRQEPAQREGTTQSTEIAKLSALIVDYAWQAKKRGLADSTIKQRVYRLKHLLREGANLTDPDSVCTVLATRNWSESNKWVFIVAYQSFARTYKISWEKPKTRVERKLPFIPTEEEIDQLIAGCGKKTATFIQVLKDTGARTAEAAKLQWTDIDEKSCTIRINNPVKGSLARIVKVPAKTISMINSLPKTNAYIFNTNAQTIRNLFDKQRSKIAARLQNPRLRQIHLHTLRHWKATMEYHRTKNIKWVQQLLGHKKLETTDMYTQLISFQCDEWHVAHARNLEEETKLIEAGFEYVRYSEKDQVAIYRKRK